MLKTWLSRLHPLYETPGGGTGGGSATGSGGGAGTGGAGGGAGGAGGSSAGNPAGAGAGAGGSPTSGTGAGGPFEFRDDAQLRLSDGRIVTGAQYRQELQQQIDGEYRGRYQRGYDLLLAEAKRLDGLSRGGHQQQTQPEDPLADIRNMPVVDGATAARLVQMLRDQGLGPLANVVATMQKELQQTKTQLGEFGKRFGSQDEDQEAQRFESKLDQVLAGLEVKGLNGKIDAQSEPIRQYARNLYLSYVPSSWKAGEFEQQLSREFSDLVAAVRAMDRGHVEEARNKVRRNFNPERGAATPGGGGKYKFQRPRELAAMAAEAGMFSGPQT